MIDGVVLPLVREHRRSPQAVDDVEPLRGSRVAVVVLIERHAVHPRLGGPPGRDDVQRQAAVADVIDVRGLLGQERRRVKRRPDGDHDLELVGDRRQRRGRAPGVERRRLRAFDVVQVQLGDEREVEADLLAAPRQTTDVLPRRFHRLVVDVPQPAAEDGKPISETHHTTPAVAGTPAAASSASSQSASRANGSKPRMRVPSATKFESALMS